MQTKTIFIHQKWKKRFCQVFPLSLCALTTEPQILVTPLSFPHMTKTQVWLISATRIYMHPVPLSRLPPYIPTTPQKSRRHRVHKIWQEKWSTKDLSYSFHPWQKVQERWASESGLCEYLISSIKEIPSGLGEEEERRQWSSWKVSYLSCSFLCGYLFF